MAQQVHNDREKNLLKATLKASSRSTKTIIENFTKSNEILPSTTPNETCMYLSIQKPRSKKVKELGLKKKNH
jgi:hypothetical protein